MSMTPKIAEANYGFQKGKTACSEEVHDWAGEFIHNFVWDSEFYLKRVPELKDEMSIYSSGPNCHVVPYKHVGWTILSKLISMWS